MSTFESRIKGNQTNLFLEELLKNSIHFPISILILESLNEGGFEFFKLPDPYILMTCALLQAFVLSYLRTHKKPLIFWGYLVSPLVYVALEAPIEGIKFFSATQHIAFWFFSLMIGVAANLNTNGLEYFQNYFIVVENILRTFIPIAMYIIFEAKEKSLIDALPPFFADPAHLFLSLVMILLGVVFGFAGIQDRLNKNRILKLTEQLKNYSTWYLGENVLNEAMDDEEILNIKRVERSMFFIDIRGFTKWSEHQSPESVVTMLNGYYLHSDLVLKNFQIVKVKYTADEIMVVFKDSGECIAAALMLRNHLNGYLKKYSLNAGGGVNKGEVVEGMIGSENNRLFDVIGDTVNMTKRLCENAAGNEILISEKMKDVSMQLGEPRQIHLKGIEAIQTVYPLNS